MLILLLNGKKGSGKDYIAKHLVEKHGYKRYAFADIMKDILGITFSITRSDIEESKNGELTCLEGDLGDNWLNRDFLNDNMRYILQKFGTEAMKKYFGQNIWVKLLSEKIKEECKHNDKIVISDFRFLIEYEEMNKNFFTGFLNYNNKRGQEEINKIKTIKINTYQENKDSHISENELNNFNFDIEVFNDKKSTNVIELIDQEINKIEREAK